MNRLRRVRKLKEAIFGDRIERLLLILTFLCIAIATTYSVRIARRALEQSEISLRPWIALPNINTFIDSDHLSTEFEILNVGTVPAYVQVSIAGYIDDRQSKHMNPEREMIISAVFPGQSILRGGIRVSGNLFRRILEGNQSLSIKQEITVSYGVTRERLDYSTSQLVEFIHTQLPEVINNGKQARLWRLVSTRFK